MYIADPQKLLTAGLSALGLLGETVSKGEVMDYAIEKCLDKEGNIRCTKPFLVAEGGCYNLEWTTDGTLSHTTVEVRDAGSSEIVYYRDTNGQWKPEKNELVYLDFKPKVWKTGNDTVTYKVTECESENQDSL
ncbi:hypothetical protein VHEMI07020 [[Torrubiella] hemipterigena]|uniref:CND01770-like protein n=1 Tax=[Torrubiella] hemipterigena TaxID=1531966 RepID=A0A0A1TKW9_9HYPO|nr:hypothetical protein VHEMI07020 [[Torrubiella] hemipterigena]